jgi:hypothetical protein
LAAGLFHVDVSKELRELFVHLVVEGLVELVEAVH